MTARPYPLAAPAGPDRPGGDAPPLAERRLGPGDLDRVLALHEATHRAAPASALFVRESPEFFAAHLGAAGQVLGLETPDGALVCYAVLGLPAAADAQNFGRALGLGAGDRGRVCHLDGTAVLPGWRGRGLQRRMTVRRLALARGLGRDIALSTAALRNVWSLANLTAAGLRVVALVEKYDALRLMLRADAGAPAPDLPWTAQAAARPVRLDGRPEGHRALLAQGWQGVAVRRMAGAAVLVYLPRPEAGPDAGPDP